MRKYFVVITLFFVIVSCADEVHYAPVTDIANSDPIPKNGVHHVQRDETLYEIAWRYGLDYRYLAARNHIAPPYIIHVNDKVELQGKSAVQINKEEPIIAATPSLEPSVTVKQDEKQVVQAEPHFSVTKWLRPANGRIIDVFSSQQKGINIAGQLGDPVIAAADGKVVYSGNGLKRYGNLVILKHNNLYLSAYAHNQQLFVREGDWVKQGQIIGEMGKTGTNKVMLHFEIRKAGKPVNPRLLLGS